jgi:hypothetical protein
VVEGARLESVYRGNSIQGSNPCLSASSKSLLSCHTLAILLTRGIPEPNARDGPIESSDLERFCHSTGVPMRNNLLRISHRISCLAVVIAIH